MQRYALNLAVVGALAVPMTLDAQAVLIGRVVNDSTKAPIAGAEIILEPNARRLESDSLGRFVLDRLPLGAASAIVRKIGYRGVRIRTLIFSSDTLDVEVPLEPAGAYELAPIEVVASGVPPGMAAYAERRLRGTGSYIDADELRRSEYRGLSDLLRMQRGIRMASNRYGRWIVTGSRSNCPMSIWLDGVKIYSSADRIGPPDIDDFPIAQLEAIEIYRGGADTPPELDPGKSSCGTIVLWTRRR
ncbi:MAG: carboxypeptidase regulatory-like domain-containing protein [Gemmatimonadales bacterium]|nr:carboxypeptidase regulatory-like domain-containing protein [Gemmatimonadales bacterium]